MAKLKQKPKMNLIGIAVAGLIVAAAGIYLVWSSFAYTSPCASMKNGAAKVKCYAEEQIGIKESPANTNRGGAIDFWNKQAGGKVGDDWCASFVSRMLYMGYGSHTVNAVWTGDILTQFGRNGHSVKDFGNGTYKLYPGWILYRPRGRDTGHVGIVRYYNATNGHFETIEGNVNCGSNDCVRVRSYYKDGTPKDSDASTTQKWTKLLMW